MHIYNSIYMPGTIKRSLSRVARAATPPAPAAEKVGVFLKLDRDVLAWFQRGGRGYQSRMNEVLKRFVREVEGAEPPGVLERAQELYDRYYDRCFWHMRPDLIVTAATLPVVIDGLRKYGGREGYREAGTLCP